MATRYIGLKEMCQLTGKSHPTLWRMWAKKKDFPVPHNSKHLTTPARTPKALTATHQNTRNTLI